MWRPSAVRSCHTANGGADAQLLPLRRLLIVGDIPAHPGDRDRASPLDCPAARFYSMPLLRSLLPLYVRLWAVQQALLLHGFQDDLTP
eukprot:COSAG05_NODE_5955_length_1051_cov_2.676471_1_plen_87_part_10